MRPPTPGRSWWRVIRTSTPRRPCRRGARTRRPAAPAAAWPARKLRSRSRRGTSCRDWRTRTAGLCWIAPLKAPFSNPNSSDSRSRSQRGAVHFHERLVLRSVARAARGRRALAGAALAPRSARHVGVGHPFDQIADFGHRLAVAEEHRVARFSFTAREAWRLPD